MYRTDNNVQKYIKSFSKGQITVPKEIREALGIGDTFWLKVYLNQDKIIAEPVESASKDLNYAEKLLEVEGKWFSETEIKKTRKQIEKRLKKNED